jgi:hypothetical protein
VRGAENTGDGFLYELTRINRGDVVSSLSYNRGWFNRLWCQVRSVFSSSDIAIGAFIIVHTLSDAMVGTDTLDAFTEIVRTIITDWKKGVIVALTHKMACANARAAKTGVWDAQHYDGLVRAVATANGPAAAAAIAARRAFVESLAYDDYVKCVHAHIARTFHIDHDCVFVFDNLTTAADTPAARPADASAIALLALKAIRMAENQIGQIGQR